jgi:DNA-binding CsgD family transcriptional regulator
MRREQHEVEMKSHSTDPNILQALSSREHEILRLVAEGKTSREIADRLSISPKTVDTYRSRLMHKIGVKNLAALVKFAIRHGLISLE